MSEQFRKTYVVTGKTGLRPAMVTLWEIARQAIFDRALVLTISNKQSKRSLEQNKKLWAMLSDIAKQVQWPVNGTLSWLEPEDWKDILSAAVKQANGREVKIAQGIDGGFVFLGQRTSKMRVKEMAELIEFMYAFGSDRDVKWSEPMPEEWYELAAA